MRINRFKDVAIPQNKDYFARLSGADIKVPDSAFSGDQVAPMPMNKTDELDMYARYGEQLAKEAKQKSDE